MQTNVADDYKRMPVRCDLGDPNACTSCGRFLAVPGTQWCPCCKGVGELALTRQGLYNFKMGRVQKRVQALKNHPEARSLATEITVLRVLLEDTINQVQGDQYEWLTHEAQIRQLVLAIKDTLVVNTKVEERIGELLSLDQLIDIVQMFFNIIQDYISDPAQLQEIADRINGVITGNTGADPASDSYTPATLNVTAQPAQPDLLDVINADPSFVAVDITDVVNDQLTENINNLTPSSQSDMPTPVSLAEDQTGATGETV